MPDDDHAAVGGVLLELMARLAAPGPVDDALRAVTDVALRLVPGDHASVRLLDDSLRELRASARSGRGAHVGSLPLGRSVGVAGWVLDHRDGVRIDDVTKDARFVQAMGQGFSIRSMIAEPIWSDGRVIGVLCVSSAGLTAFGPAHSLLAQLLAAACVPAIERARGADAATVDQLTLALTAECEIPRVEAEMARVRAAGRLFSLVRVKIDGFAAASESFGREVGDRILCIFADRVRASTRLYDAFVRVGDNDFAILLAGAEASRARAIAERIRVAVLEPMEPLEGAVLTQSASLGVATWDGVESARELRARADSALAAASEVGNRVV